MCVCVCVCVELRAKAIPNVYTKFQDHSSNTFDAV